MSDARPASQRERHERFLSTMGKETWRRLIVEFFKDETLLTDDQIAGLVALRVQHMKIDRRIAATCRETNRKNGVAA